MSRFAQGRWSRILVWTGAALAWGSALVATLLQPPRDQEPPVDMPGQMQTVDAGGMMPNLPDRGLVVIRTGKTQTVESGALPAQTVPTLAPGSAPEMASSGS
jgi:hypothetical protein